LNDLDNTTGSTAGVPSSGQAGTSPSPPPGGQTAPSLLVGGNPSEVPAAPATSTETAQTASTAPASWFDRLSPDDKAYAENKGWKADTGVDAIFQSYQHLEKLLGADRAGRTVVLPKDGEDKAALNAIYDKLGRPKTAAEYDLSLALPEGADNALIDGAKQWFHEAGLSAEQAKAVTSAYVQMEKAAAEKVNSAYALEIDALKREWGAEFPRRVEVAKGALRAAGLDEAATQALESALGPARAARIMEFFGRNYAEGMPPDAGAKRSSGFSSQSPASAAQRMAALRADAAFMARYDHNDPAVRAGAIQEMAELAKLAANRTL